MKNNNLLFYQIAELTNDGLWLLGADQTTTYINPKMLEMLGYGAEEILGRPPVDFVSSDMRDLVSQKMILRRAGVRESYDLKYRRKDGSLLWAIVSTSPIFDPEGNFQGVIAVHTDITEKKLIEEEIQKKEALLATLIENIPAAIFVKSVEGELILANKAFETNLNKPFSELRGRSTLEHLPPELRKKSIETDRVILETKKPIESQHTGDFPDGARYLRTVKFPLLNQQNDVYAICGLIFDETERRKIAQSLQESNERFQQMAENVGEVFWLVSRDTFRVEYISPAFERIWGIPVKDMLDNPSRLLNTIDPEDQKNFTSPFSEVEKSGKMDVQIRITRPDNSRRWIWLRAFGIYDNAGRVEKLCGVATDITGQKQAELLLESQKSQMLAAAKMSSLGEMAAGIAHEVNNPLTIINLLSTQLRERLKQGKIIENEELIDRLTRIEKTTERIARIVNGLRTFSRDGTKDPIQIARVDTIVTDTLNLCTERFKGHSVQLTIAPIPEDVRIACRPIQISQVLLNLLNNAFDAVSTHPNERWVRLEVINHEKRVQIKITDSGQGIRPETMTRLFQPFFTTKDAGKGTGLGLSISRGIVEDHGGTIMIDPQSKNTCFTIDLPKKSPVLRPD